MKKFLHYLPAVFAVLYSAWRNYPQDTANEIIPYENNISEHKLSGLLIDNMNILSEDEKIWECYKDTKNCYHLVALDISGQMLKEIVCPMMTAANINITACDEGLNIYKIYEVTDMTDIALRFAEDEKVVLTDCSSQENIYAVKEIGVGIYAFKPKTGDALGIFDSIRNRVYMLEKYDAFFYKDSF